MNNKNYRRSLTMLLKKELSPIEYYSKFKSKWHHILLGGALDALTTIVGVSIFSITELNPMINQLIPDHIYLVPLVLVEMAFLRYIVVSAMFKKSRYLNWAVYFTLYFLPAWNLVNIVYTQVI